MLQRCTIQILHCDERSAVFLAYIMNGADVWMVQRRRRLRFALETGECLRVSGNLLRQELQRNEAMQPCILGFVDDTHPAVAELFEDAIVRDGLPNQS